MFSGCSMRVNNLLHSLTVALWTWPDWVAGRCDNKERVTFYDKRVCNTWLGFSISTKQIRTFKFTLVLSINFFLDYFYLLIFYFLKFSTWIWGLQFTVRATLNSLMTACVGLFQSTGFQWLLSKRHKSSAPWRQPNARLVDINEVWLRGKCHRTEVKCRTEAKCLH